MTWGDTLVAMVTLLVLVAFALALVGAATLTEATAGVGIVGLACLFGILARIAQASVHRDQAEKRQGERDKEETDRRARDLDDDTDRRARDLARRAGRASD